MSPIELSNLREWNLLRMLVSLTELSKSASAIARDFGDSNRDVKVTKLERQHYRCRMGQHDRGLSPRLSRAVSPSRLNVNEVIA